MKILITGINGFIGKQLLNSVEDRNDFALFGVGRQETCDKINIMYYQADISDSSALQQMVVEIGSCDVIIHIAAYINMDFDARETIDSNIIGTYNICNLARALSCKKIIYLSSIPIIGQPKTLPITEEHPLQPETMYHISKLSGEYMINLMSQYKISPIILRIPSPIGIGMNRKNILPIFINQAMKHQDIVLYGKGQRRQNYIDVRDIASAIISAVKADAQGVFNIASSRNYSNFELAEECIKVVNSKSKICFNGLEDPQENYNWDISINKARNLLGFLPVYELAESIEWFLKSQ